MSPEFRLKHARIGSTILVTLSLLLLCVATSNSTYAHGFARLDSSTLPSGSSVQLTPTYSTHTGSIPTVSVGQGTTFNVVIPIQNCGGTCWVDQGYPIDVYIVEVNHEGEPNSCSQSPAAIKMLTTRNGTAFNLQVGDGFAWPSSATSTAFGSPWYAICIHVEVPKNSQFYPKPDFVTGAAADEGTNNVYKVICDHAPADSVSPLQLTQGQSVTVTGHYWVPVYSDVPETVVHVSIRSYPDPNHYVIWGAIQQPAVDASGNWTVSFPITVDFSPGTYYACIGSQVYNTCFSEYKQGIPFQVVDTSSAPQPTASLPTPTSTSSSTTPTVTVTITATVSQGTTPTTPAQPTPLVASAGVPFFALLAIVGGMLLCIVGGGVIWYVVRRRATP